MASPFSPPFIPKYLLSLPFGQTLLSEWAEKRNPTLQASRSGDPQSGLAAPARLAVKLSSMGLLGLAPARYINAYPEYLQMLAPILSDQASGTSPQLGRGASTETTRASDTDISKAEGTSPPENRETGFRGFLFNPNHDLYGHSFIVDDEGDDDDDEDLDADDIDDDDTYEDGTVSISLNRLGERDSLPHPQRRVGHNPLVESATAISAFDRLTDVNEVALFSPTALSAMEVKELLIHLPTTWMRPEWASLGVTVEVTRALNLVEVSVTHTHLPLDPASREYTFVHANTSISQNVGIFYFETEIMSELVSPSAGRTPRTHYRTDGFPHLSYTGNNDLIIGFIQTHVLNDTTTMPTLSALTHSPLINPHSLVLSVNDAVFYNRAGKKAPLPAGCTFKKGDVVGLGLNLITSTVFVTCNGVTYAEFQEEYRDLTPRHLCSVRCERRAAKTNHWRSQETNEWMPMVLCSQGAEQMRFRSNFGVAQLQFLLRGSSLRAAANLGGAGLEPSGEVETDFRFDIVGYVRHCQDTVYRKLLQPEPLGLTQPIIGKERRRFGKEVIKQTSAAKVGKKTGDVPAMNRLVMSFLTTRGHAATAKAFAADLTGDGAPSNPLDAEETTHVNNRRHVVDLLTANNPEGAFRFCATHYPALVPEEPDRNGPSLGRAAMSAEVRALSLATFFLMECLCLHQMLDQQTASEDETFLAEIIRYSQRVHRKYSKLSATAGGIEPSETLTALLTKPTLTHRDGRGELWYASTKRRTARMVNNLILLSLGASTTSDLEVMVSETKQNLDWMRDMAALDVHRLGERYVESAAVCLLDFLA